MQLQNAGISRKQDYRKYMQLFAGCENIDDSHCLSAHVFGVMNVAHILNDSLRTLSDDDLHPMADAMSKIEDAHARIESSEIALREATALAEEYDRYNRYKRRCMNAKNPKTEPLFWMKNTIRFPIFPDWIRR